MIIKTKIILHLEETIPIFNERLGHLSQTMFHMFAYVTTSFKKR